MVEILKDIDFEWWTNNCYNFEITQEIGSPTKITLELPEQTFYKLNNSMKEMEKKEMPPKNFADYTLNISADTTGLTCNFSDLIATSISNYYSDEKDEEKMENKEMKSLQVKSIRYEKDKENKNYTTVTWNDGTKTTVRCSQDDEYSRYDGFCSALAKKVFGTSSQVRKIVETKDEAIEIAKKKKEQAEKDRIAEIKRNRKMKHQIKYRARQIVIEKKAKELAKKMMGE